MKAQENGEKKEQRKRKRKNGKIKAHKMQGISNKLHLHHSAAACQYEPPPKSAL